MLITQTITWPTTNWPSSSPATQYTVYQVFPGPVTALQNVSTNSAALTYDDSQNLAYQIRPSSGALNALTQGPELSVFLVNYVTCRAWLRNKVRQALADRADQVGVTLNWPDDELNTYSNEAIGELNVLFPIEEVAAPILLQAPIIDINGNTAGVRQYSLPADLYLVNTIEYVTADGKLHLFLKEKPWRGGETTATSYLGYPKLGIMLSPLAGRFFPGHYYVFNSVLNIDWDPPGNGDYLNVTYFGRRALPVNDADLLNVTLEDMELLNLYVQMKCWLRVEGSDVRLSRWRGRDDGSRRDDLPTIRQSSMIQQLYNQRINDRRELRPKTRRLVRR